MSTAKKPVVIPINNKVGVNITFKNALRILATRKATNQRKEPGKSAKRI